MNSHEYIVDNKDGTSIAENTEEKGQAKESVDLCSLQKCDLPNMCFLNEDDTC